MGNQNKQCHARRWNHQNKQKKTENMWKSLILLKDKLKQLRGVFLGPNWP